MLESVDSCDGLLQISHALWVKKMYIEFPLVESSRERTIKWKPCAHRNGWKWMRVMETEIKARGKWSTRQQFVVC